MTLWGEPNEPAYSIMFTSLCNMWITSQLRMLATYSKNRADLTISTYINMYCKIDLFNCMDGSLEAKCIFLQTL